MADIIMPRSGNSGLVLLVHYATTSGSALSQSIVPQVTRCEVPSWTAERTKRRAGRSAARFHGGKCEEEEASTRERWVEEEWEGLAVEALWFEQAGPRRNETAALLFHQESELRGGPRATLLDDRSSRADKGGSLADDFIGPRAIDGSMEELLPSSFRFDDGARAGQEGRCDGLGAWPGQGS
ncbi:hypothetical protein KM043_010986 [Ampulex compressa]|nr:hypothetical protein KM043_010986 [Ampulex compressa]